MAALGVKCRFFISDVSLYMPSSLEIGQAVVIITNSSFFIIIFFFIITLDTGARRPLLLELSETGVPRSQETASSLGPP